MKKSLFLTFLVIAQFVYSQNFVQDNKQWNVYLEVFGVGGVSHYTEIYSTIGDTLVNQTTYKKLYYSPDSLLSKIYKGALREDNQKIFYLNNFGEEGLLYDFSLETNDTAYVVANMEYGYDSLMVVVDSVDYIEINGIERKILWIHNDISWEPIDYWMEGLGSNNGPLNTFIHCYIICPWWQLSCVYENGEQIYQHENLDCYANNVGTDEKKRNQIHLSPNPIIGGEYLLIQLPENYLVSEIECYDLRGNLVFNLPVKQVTDIKVQFPKAERGIYILKLYSQSEGIISMKMIVE